MGIGKLLCVQLFILVDECLREQMNQFLGCVFRRVSCLLLFLAVTEQHQDPLYYFLCHCLSWWLIEAGIMSLHRVSFLILHPLNTLTKLLMNYNVHLSDLIECFDECCLCYSLLSMLIVYLPIEGRFEVFSCNLVSCGDDHT